MSFNLPGQNNCYQVEISFYDSCFSRHIAEQIGEEVNERWNQNVHFQSSPNYTEAGQFNVLVKVPNSSEKFLVYSKMEGQSMNYGKIDIIMKNLEKLIKDI